MPEARGAAEQGHRPTSPSEPSGLDKLGAAFHSFCERLMDADPFKTKRVSAFSQARRYLSGLVLSLERKNIERINQQLEAETTPDNDYEAMQHFLSGSTWQSRKVFDFIAEQADGRLGGRPDTVLVIDESAFSKKGSASAGVARQHNGRLGKRDNCQVGVFSVLNCGTHSVPVGAELFLPDEWVQDPERCQKAGIPEELIQPRTKIDIARDLIEQAREQGIRFACISMDAFYGRDSKLLEWLNDKGLSYSAEVPANALIFTEAATWDKRPKPISKHAKRVDEVAKELATEPGETITLREAENGQLEAEFWARRVWVWPADRDKARECWLLVRRMSDGSLKTILSNAPEDTPIRRLALWQGARFFVERCFQDGKSHAGMAGYQVRGWVSWHHHMAMVSLALLFMMEQRLLLAESAPLLSAADIVELLDWHIRKPRTEAQTIAAITNRHHRRERNALNALNRDRRKSGLPKIRDLPPNSLPK